MIGDAFVVVFLKPEIATGFFKFTTTPGDSDDDDAPSSSEPPSSIPGVSAVEAAFLLPNGNITPTVFSRIKSVGFEIVQQRMKDLTKAEARQLFSYELHHRFNDEQDFAAFLNAVTCGPSLALLLKLPAALSLGDANAAIKKWVELAGDWDPVVARKKALAASTPHDQWPLRALCGLNTIQNGLASSPHVCCTRRERFFLFPPAAPQLNQATIVLLPSFHSNFPDGKDILLSAIGMDAQAIIIDSREGCPLSDDQVVPLCGLARTSDEGAPQMLESLVQLAHETVGDNGVDVIVLEGLDLKFTLRFVVGPANVEMAKLYFPESIRGQLPNKLPSVELPAGIHPNETAGDDALGFESGLFLSFDPNICIDNIVGTSSQIGSPIESTLGLIKPNAACKPEVVAEILEMVALFGFTVERQRCLLLSRDQAAAFYAEHHGKPFFPTLLDFMTSGEIVALQLSRPHAIKIWRGLMGPTNSIKARETYPWTLRARFGVDGTRNATHGSDSTASAARELCFFFGSTLSASSSTSKQPSGAFVNARTVAQQPIAKSSIEKVLAQGLKELVEKKLSDPLEACRWLGEWLVAYRSRGHEDPESHDEAQIAMYLPKAMIGVDQSVDHAKGAIVRKIVAITLDGAISSTMRSAVLDALRKQLGDLRYEVVDVSTELKKLPVLNVAVANLVKILNDCGRRLCVLFDCDEFTPDSMFHREFKALAPANWQINSIVRLELQTTGADSVVTPSPSLDIPILHFSLPQEVQKDGALDGLFHAVFDPNIVLLADPQKLVPVGIWTEVAKQFGFHLLSFDGFVDTVKNSNDKSDEAQLLVQLARSGATVPPTLILTSLRRVVLGDNATQKFLLLGFPWSNIQAAELEQTIGRPQSVLVVGEKAQRLKTNNNSPAWTTAFRKEGLVKRVWIDSTFGVDRRVVCSALHGALSPVVGCFLGRCDREEQLQSLQIVAKTLGFVWVDCAGSSIPSAQKLRELLLRLHAGREKFLLYGYPQTSAQAIALLDIVGAPEFALLDSSSTTPVAQDLLVAFDAQPRIIQLDLSSNSSNGPLQLRSTLFRRQVVAVVGSVGSLDLADLRNVVGALGFNVIDLRHDEHQKDDEFERLLEFERRVQAVQAPRCLVVGAPATPSFFRALEARIGCAMHKILILQHVQVRVRAPDAMEDGGDSDDFSDEEQSHQLQVEENGSDTEETSIPTKAGQVAWQKVMKALSPQLSQLLGTFATSSDSFISIDVIGFLETNPSQAVQDVAARLRPRFFGVVGHPFSFYQNVVASFCRRKAIGFINLRNISSSLDALEVIENHVMTTPHCVYCLDGFPRSSHPDAIAPSISTASSPPRHVQQQLWELDRRLGALNTLVHFTATVNVLEQQTPEQVTRRMLDAAQDDLELASNDLVRLFSTGRNRHLSISEVSCDRTLQDAQEELGSALHRVLRPSKPAIKQKGG